MRSRLGANGRAVYEQQYSWTVLSKRLLDLYQAVLTEASR
jgi:glycosyltransferase involved in cell wall biosynthesis